MDAPARESAPPQEAPPPPEESTPSLAELPCHEVPPDACRGQGPRCVWDPAGSACRDPVDACEAVVPEPSWRGQPLFRGADPCENVLPGCAWSAAARRCVPFAPVTRCPASLDEARTASVSCDHSQQPELSCRYRQTRCECRAPTRCPGGMAPDPAQASPPSQWTCVSPTDERGCPTAGARSGAPCQLDPDVMCTTCTGAAQCVGGRWRVRTLRRP
ncbi:MAG: hypothetical protein R3B82_24020 [Sandaracinaceae bacterium]